MLPKIVVEKLNSGSDTAETFDSVTLYFSTVAGFSEIANNCNAIQVKSVYWLVFFLES